MMKKKYILIGHKKRQGKDTFAKMLVEELGDAKIISFADPMREILAELVGVTVEELKVIYNDDDEVRDMMKRLGSGKMVEYFGETVWRDLLIKRAEASEAKWIVVPDFRFKREFIEGAETVNVIRNEGDGDTHKSEAELDEWFYNITIKNSCCLQHLRSDAEDTAELLNVVFDKKEDKETAEAFENPVMGCLGGGEYWVTPEIIKAYGEDLLSKLNNKRGFVPQAKEYDTLLKDDEHQDNTNKVYSEDLLNMLINPMYIYMYLK